MRIILLCLLLAPGIVSAQIRWSTAPLIQLGMEEGKVPLWWDAGDKTTTTISGWMGYACMTDAATGARQVTGTSVKKIQAYLDGATWLTSGAGRPITQTEWNLCFTGPLPPVALGEPAYSAVNITPAGALDWAFMNQTSVVGTTVAGEPCGPATLRGFFLLPRIPGAVTRCGP